MSTRVTLAGITRSIRVKCEGQCGRGDGFGQGGTVKGNGRQKKGGEGMREDERRKKIYYARINLFET